MNTLEKNIQFLWQKGDINNEVWLCLYSFRSTNIHVRIVKGENSGEYFASCAAPVFKLHSFNLRELLINIFLKLDTLTNDPYHKSTIKRVFAFFEELKVERSLYELWSDS